MEQGEDSHCQEVHPDRMELWFKHRWSQAKLEISLKAKTRRFFVPLRSSGLPDSDSESRMRTSSVYLGVTQGAL